MLKRTSVTHEGYLSWNYGEGRPTGYDLDKWSLSYIFNSFEDKYIRVTIEEIEPPTETDEEVM
jgi:hypothetical protein